MEVWERKKSCKSASDASKNKSFFSRSGFNVNRYVILLLFIWGVVPLQVGLAQAQPDPSNQLSISVPISDIEPAKIRQVDGNQAMINIGEFPQGGNPGDPMLPYKLVCLLVPPDANLETVNADMVSESWEELPGEYEVAPAPPAATWHGEKFIVDWGGKDKSRIINGRDSVIYGSDTYFPSEPVQIVAVGNFRQWKIVEFRVWLAVYNPVQKKVRVLKDAQTTLTVQKLPAGRAVGLDSAVLPPIPKTEKFINELRPKIDNPQDIDVFYGQQQGTAIEEGPAPSLIPADYVIITTSTIVANSTKLANFIASKQTAGVTIKTITEGVAESDTSYISGATCDQRANNIRTWLKNHWSSDGIEYVLLIGNPDPSVFSNNNSVPMKMCWAISTDTTPSDMYFAELSNTWDLDVDGKYGEFVGDYGAGGADKYCEVKVGRIPFYGTYADLDSILQKCVDYENATGNLDWRKKVLIPAAVSNFGPQDNTGDGVADAPVENASKRTFGADWGEAIKSLASSSSFSPYTLYEKQGIYSDGSAYPLTTCNASLTNANFINEWKNHYGFVTWWAHGNATSAARFCWTSDSQYVNICGNYPPHLETTFANTLVQSSDCALLDNNTPSFVVQVSCQNAWPENSSNLGYSLLKKGAVGTISGTRDTSYAVGSWNTRIGRSYGDNASYGYYCFDRMANSGESIGTALVYCRSIFGTGWAESWMNMVEFSVYGDPSLKLDIPGRTVFLVEDFEAAFVNGAPPGWTKSYKSGSPTVDWARYVGDEITTDIAYSGTYNARLFIANNTSNHETYLISPVVNFGTTTTDAKLEFWHKQRNWAGDQDTLKVYYKTSAGGAWTEELASYTTDFPDWTKRVISLPNPNSTYYIGFLGNAKYGYGVCIDDVKVSGIVAAPGQAGSPSPFNDANGVGITTDLSWTAGSGATSHDVYFGTNSSSLPCVSSAQTATTYDTGTMSNNTTYYWRIDEKNAGGTTTGTVWNFTTIVAAPGQATSPSPANDANGVGITTDLNWTAGSGTTSHDVYFGTNSSSLPIVSSAQTATTYDTGTMSNNTTYYWRIDEKNAGGTTTGTVWNFTTIVAAPGQATSLSPANDANGVGITTDLSWTAGSGATSHDVYFGTNSSSLPIVSSAQTATTYDTGTMSNNTTYYWRIDEKNAGGTTTGAVWNFTTIGVAPVITQHPQDIGVYVGQDASFTVTASGSAPLHYLWTQNDANVGSDNPTLTLYNVQLADNGAAIKCTVSNTCGSAISQTATLTVMLKFTVTASAGQNGSIEPNGVFDVNFGEDVNFNAIPNVGYDVNTWYLDGNSIQIGGSTYTLENITADHAVYVTFKQLQYTISGTITETDGNTPVEGVLMDANSTGESPDVNDAVTDANGYYAVVVPYGWSGTATPQKKFYTFEPDSNTYTNVTQNYSDANYTASLITFKISGHVLEKKDGITPIIDVNVCAANGGGPWTSRYGRGCDITDVNGYYEVTVDCNWSGKVTPAKYAYAFEPNSIAYTNVLADQNEQDYTGWVLTFAISGYIKNNCNAPIQGVLVDANAGGGESVTDVNGFYEVWVDYNWSGTVTPSKAYYTFEPNTIDYNDVLSHRTNQNYQALNIYDLDCNGYIGYGDLAVIHNNWLKSSTICDFNTDGIVNFSDFAEFANVWLTEYEEQ